MWYLFFLFTVFLTIFTLAYPFLVEFDIRLNVLKLKGRLKVKLFGIIKIEYKIRIKHGYIYINHKNLERKEKISATNINLMFLLDLVRQLYFRQQLITLGIVSNFGYSNDSCNTAVGCGAIDVISKGVLSKIKNNKKSSHIFVSVEPKYNQDVCNFRLTTSVRNSLFDIIYSLLYAALNIRSKKYVHRKRRNNT